MGVTIAAPWQFHRWAPHSGVSIAYRLFSKDVAELNDFCWHAQGTINHAKKAISPLADREEIRQVVDYGADTGRRADTLVGHARSGYADVENWVRLSTVVCLASLLELFVRRIVVLTLESDPGLLIHRSKVIDGVELLKRGDVCDHAEHVENCTTGVWSKREEGLRRVFGVRLAAVFDNLAELQAIQTLRNSVAHDFARTTKAKDFWYLDPAQAYPQPMTRISSSRLQNLMRVVGLVGEALETQAAHHVGSFELFRFWHLFVTERSNPKHKHVEQYVRLYRMGGVNKLLSSYSSRMTGTTIGRDYCRDLLKHYDKC